MTQGTVVRRPLRILVVNWLDRQNPQAGGAEVHLHETFGRLARRGHEVTLLCSGWTGCAPDAELDGIRVHRAGTRYTFSLTAPRRLRIEPAGGPPDVVVEDLNKVPVFTPWWTRAPVVLLVHHLFGLTAFKEANPALAAATWLLERPVPRVFHGRPVIAVSDSTRDDLVARGMERDRIEVVPNGVDLDHFTPDTPGLRYSQPTVLYVGRVKKYKRVDLILAAMAALRTAGVAARLVVAGKGDHLDSLRTRTRSLGLQDHVEFLGFVPEEKKLELLRRSWVHVLTSPKEGWGISNLEAAACGTPTVASDSPGLRESVRDGETGFLVPHGDVEALTRRLETLLTDTELRTRLGARARAFAQGFSWEASARRIEGILNRVVGSSDRD